MCVQKVQNRQHTIHYLIILMNFFFQGMLSIFYILSEKNDFFLAGRGSTTLTEEMSPEKFSFFMSFLISTGVIPPPPPRSGRVTLLFNVFHKSVLHCSQLFALIEANLIKLE